MGDTMSANRTFGLVMVVLGAVLLWFMTTGGLNTAPLILVFGSLGGLGAVILGVRVLLGKV